VIMGTSIDTDTDTDTGTDTGADIGADTDTVVCISTGTVRYR